MTDQAHAWSRIANDYEKEFVDPYRANVRTPLPAILAAIENPGRKTVADLGCGTGPLLPELSKRFEKVYAVDFAPGMLERARRRCGAAGNVEFVERSLLDLTPLSNRLDLAISINSLVMPDVRDQEQALHAIYQALKPGGLFVSILPAIDAVHYYTMLLVDRALEMGKPLPAARKNAAHLNDHALYDFAFGQFRFQGIEQHFWQPFEIAYRFERAGFRNVKLTKVLLDWEQFSWAAELHDKPAPWDWFGEASKSG